MPSPDDVQRHSVHTLVFRSLKRSHDMFMCDQGNLPPPHVPSENFKRNVKTNDQYGPVLERVAHAKKAAQVAAAAQAAMPLGILDNGNSTTLALEAAPGSHPLPAPTPPISMVLAMINDLNSFVINFIVITFVFFIFALYWNSLNSVNFQNLFLNLCIFFCTGTGAFWWCQQ